MGAIGKLIQDYKDGQKYRPSTAQIANVVGVTRTTVGNWIAGTASLPTPENLRSLSRAIDTPYLRVLDAALMDAGYLPRGGGDVEPPMNPRTDDVSEATAEQVPVQEPPAVKPKRSPRAPRKSSPPG